MSDAAESTDQSNEADLTTPTDQTTTDEFPTLDATPYTTLESNLPPDRNHLHAPPEHWEAVGREVLAVHLERQLADLRREIHETVCACESGSSVTSDHVTRLRDTIAALELTVETRLAPLADDAEPWKRSAHRIPTGRLLEALDLDRDDLRALRNLRRG